MKRTKTNNKQDKRSVLKCILCGKSNFKTLFSKGKYSIEKCNICGIVKTKGTSDVKYSEYHRDLDYEKYEPHFKNIFYKIYNNLSGYFVKPTKVLEIGCSRGTLLEIFKNHNWEVWGVEPSKSFWDAQAKGIKVMGVDFLNAKFQDVRFDLIIMNHTLEHLSNPLANLKKAYQILNKKGKIFIGVPNFESWSSKISGPYWSYLLPHEHTYHFTTVTLSKLLRKAGFKIIKVKTYSGIWSLANPIKGLLDEFRNRKRSFVVDLLLSPFDFLATLFNKASGLTVVAEK